MARNAIRAKGIGVDESFGRLLQPAERDNVLDPGRTGHPGNDERCRVALIGRQRMAEVLQGDHRVILHHEIDDIGRCPAVGAGESEGVRAYGQATARLNDVGEEHALHWNGSPQRAN